MTIQSLWDDEFIRNEMRRQRMASLSMRGYVTDTSSSYSRSGKYYSPTSEKQTKRVVKGKKKLEKEKKIHMFDPKELDTDDS